MSITDKNTEFALGLTKTDGGILVNANSIIEFIEEESDPYWEHVEWGFEEGRLESFSGTKDSNLMTFERNNTSNLGIFKKERYQIDVGPNAWNYRINLPVGTLYFAANESLTIEVEFRNNDNRPGVQGGFDWPMVLSNPTADNSTDSATINITNLSSSTLMLRKWYEDPMQTAMGYSVVQNEWFNLAIVIDRAANEIRWYKDGKLMGSPTSPIPFAALNFQNSYMLIGGSPYGIGFSSTMHNNTPNGGGISIRRMRFTRGIPRYSGSSYDVPKSFRPTRLSRFDPYWNKTVFHFDGSLTPDTFIDLTKRHTAIPLGTAAMDNGRTSLLYNNNYFRIVDNLDDFVFTPGEDFCIDTAYINRLRPADPTANNSYYGLNIGPADFSGQTMMWITNGLAGSLDINEPGILIIRTGTGTGTGTGTAYLFTYTITPLLMWDVMFPGLPEMINYVTIARKSNVIYAYFNGTLLKTTGVVADGQFNLQNTPAGMLVGRGTAAAENATFVRFYGIRITKGSSRGIIGQDVIPLEWGMNLNA